MTVSVLFFGATAEIAGTRRMDMDAVEGEPASAVFDHVLREFPDLAKHKLHFSVNQQFANGAETIRDRDELAIFTAVSGG